jgi:glutamate 5-kinase
MENYRMFSRPEYSIRQLLVEHQHFNDEAKRENIRRLLLRAAEQNAIPIVNYNDPVSDDEILKMELNSLKQYHEHVVECVDNDETAAVICELVGAKYLVILSSTEGIYRDAADPSTLVTDVLAGTPEALMEKVRVLQKSCSGASRAGAGGARAKLAFAAGPALKGVTVIIGHARHGINALSPQSPPPRIASAKADISRKAEAALVRAAFQNLFDRRSSDDCFYASSAANTARRSWARRARHFAQRKLQAWSTWKSRFPVSVYPRTAPGRFLPDQNPL